MFFFVCKHSAELVSRGIQGDGEQYLEHEGQEEFGLLDAELVGRAGAAVAEALLAAGRAGVELGALAYHDAAGLALVRAVALQAPHHRHRRRVLRARRVRESFHLRHVEED